MKIILIVFFVVILLFVLYTRTNKRRVIKPAAAAAVNHDSLVIDTPIAFGYKCMWMAVRTNDKEKVADLLGLKNIQPANWETGINAAYNNKIFITPQVGEWTLVVGYGLAGINSRSELDEARSYKEKAEKLSREFGEAQFFATHRITEYHVWAKAINGQISRFYSYVGERGENILIEGDPTGIERQFNLVNTFSPQAKHKNYFENKDLVIPDEDLVMKIAANWSIDPTTLEDRKDIENGFGMVGQL